jgi:hypothetical protein
MSDPDDPDRDLNVNGACPARTPPSPARRSRSGSTPRRDVSQQRFDNEIFPFKLKRPALAVKAG